MVTIKEQIRNAREHARVRRESYGQHLRDQKRFDTVPYLGLMGRRDKYRQIVGKLQQSYTTNIPPEVANKKDVAGIVARNMYLRATKDAQQEYERITAGLTRPDQSAVDQPLHQKVGKALADNAARGEMQRERMNANFNKYNWLLDWVLEEIPILGEGRETARSFAKPAGAVKDWKGERLYDRTKVIPDLVGVAPVIPDWLTEDVADVMANHSHDRILQHFALQNPDVFKKHEQDVAIAKQLAALRRKNSLADRDWRFRNMIMGIY